MYSSDDKTVCKIIREHKPANNYMKSGGYSSDSDDEKPEEEEEHNHNNEETGKIKSMRIVMVIVILAVVALSSSKVVFFLLQPNVPSFQLNSFSLSNFSVNETRLSYKWKASYTAINSDSRFSLGISNTFGYVYHNGVKVSSDYSEKINLKLSPNENALLNFTAFEDLIVPIEETGVRSTNLTEPENENRRVDDQHRQILKDFMSGIHGDGGKGKVIIMEMNLFTAGIAVADTWFAREMALEARCGNMTVRFVSETEAAAVLSSNGRTCFINSYFSL